LSAGLRKIVSGGQTGADRAALHAARSAGVAIGGWVPAGRAAEDGPIDAAFAELRETTSGEPAERTRLNVRDSDATLIVSHGPLQGGSALTFALAQELERPVLHLDLERSALPGAVELARAWLRSHPVATLNVAGPRASEDPRVYDATLAVVSALLQGRN
jgi:putative molybdenum carrier protein